MRLHRFFLDNPIEHTKTAIKDERLIHQWRDVFRYNVGSEVIVFDGNGNEYDAVIEKLTNRQAEIRLVSEREGIVPDREVVLYQSLIKKDKMEWVVEKATELGVSKIIPIISERSEKKGLNLERAQKIAIEASEQCGRADVPEVAQVMSLSEALNSCVSPLVFDSFGEDLNHESRIMNHEEKNSLHNSYFTPHNPSSLFIGPEGGWTEREIELFKEANAKIFSLGNLTLRAETAAIVALTTSKLLGSKE